MLLAIQNKDRVKTVADRIIQRKTETGEILNGRAGFMAERGSR
jgi:hypothetical protein